MARLTSLIAAFALACAAQPTIILESSDELLGTTGRNVCATHNVAVTRTSGTVLSIGTGASATAPQPIRFQANSPYVAATRSVTAAATVTTSGTGASGTAFVFGYLDDSRVLQIVVVANSNLGTLTCSAGCTVTQPFTGIAQRAYKGVYLYAWTLAGGSPAQWNVGGGFSQGAATDCRLLRAWLANTSAQTTVTITDGQSSPLPILPTPNIDAAQSIGIIFPDIDIAGMTPIYGLPAEGGLLFSAGAVSSVRLRALQVSRPLPKYDPPPPGR